MQYNIIFQRYSDYFLVGLTAFIYPTFSFRPHRWAAFIVTPAPASSAGAPLDASCIIHVCGEFYCYYAAYYYGQQTDS